MVLSAIGAFATSVLVLKLPATDQLTMIYTAGGLVFPTVVGMLPAAVQSPIYSSPMVGFPVAAGLATYGAKMVYDKMKM